MQILGAFFRYGVNQGAVWTPRLAKITEALDHWRLSQVKPDGWRHVVQMVAGGQSQFMTDIQTMPKIIIKQLTKIIQDFVWSNRINTPVAMDYLFQQQDQGGLGLLDLEARNEAITITWLRDYLDFTLERPLWTQFADDLFVSNVPKNCIPRQHTLRINPFLQAWNPKKRKLPQELRDMVNVANKYGLRLEGLAFSRSIICDMPMWDHAMADTPVLRWLSAHPTKVIDCLRDKHGLRTVGDFMDLVVVADHSDHELGVDDCECAPCRCLREDIECKSPSACIKKASELLATLPPRWDPRGIHPEDYEDPAEPPTPPADGAV